MRLKEGIVVDEVRTFGNLKFSGLRREVYERDDEGNSTGVLVKRTYDLKSEAQGRNRADATWYLNAKDLVPVGTVPGGSGTGAGKPQDKQPEKKA